MKFFKEESRKSYYTNSDSLSDEHLKIGCLMRIADAIEKMAGNYQSLINDRDWYKERYEGQSQRSEKLSRSNAALRGHFKRLKKKTVVML